MAGSREAAMGIDRHDAARAFAAKLGVTDFEALKVRGIATSDDSGMLVPAVLKAKWRRWCVTEHPDKGGDHEAFTAMGEEFSDFKEWFKAHLESDSREKMNGYEMLGAQKQRGEDATAAAEKALADQRYDDAIDFVLEARAEFEAYVAAKRLSGVRGGVTQIEREVLPSLDLIQKEANESMRRLEQEREQQVQHEALTSGLESVLRAVLGPHFSVRANTIPQKFESLITRFNEAAQMGEELKNKIAKLDDETLFMRAEIDDLTRNHREEKNKWQQERMAIEAQVALVQAENSTLKNELDEAHEASETTDRGGLLNWFGIGNKTTKKIPIKEKISAMKSEIDHLKKRLKQSVPEAKLCKAEMQNADLEKQVGELQAELCHTRSAQEELEFAKAASESELANLRSGKNKEIATKDEEISLLKERLNEEEDLLAQMQTKNTQLEKDMQNCFDRREKDASKLPEVLTGKPNFESLLGHAELNQAASGNLKYPQQEEYDFPKDEDASQRSMQQSANDSAAESTNAEATHPTASLPLGNGETTCKYTHVGDGKLIIEINLKFKGSTPALSLLVPDITVP